MRYSIYFFSIFLLFSLAACSPVSQPRQAIPAQEFRLIPGQVVTIQVNSGEVHIAGVDGDRVRLSGSLSDPGRTSLDISSTSNQILVNAEYRKPFLFASGDQAVVLEVEAPQDVSVQVETFDANVDVRDMQGEVKVNSTSGDILAENLSGKVTLRSGRGDVRAVSCSGNLSIIGEYGLLDLENLHGEVGSTTIVGSIHLSGEVDAGDRIHLETDHGPVSIDFHGSPDVSLAINSTSGNVACPSGVSSTTRTCNGKWGQGEGQITVRTVSGNVTVVEKP